MWSLLEKKSFQITLFVVICCLIVACVIIQEHRVLKYGNITTFREYSDRCKEPLPAGYTLVRDGENYAIRTEMKVDYSISADSVVRDTTYYYLMDDVSTSLIGDPALNTDSCVMKARALYHYYTYKYPSKPIRDKYNFSPL